MILNFLINTLTDWNEPPRARHQLAEALSINHKVTFVSANRFGLLPLLKKTVISENLTVIIPYFPIDNRIRYRVPLINRIYQKWLYSNLQKFYKDFYVINFDFTATYLKEYFEKRIYYCNDDYIYISAINNPAFIVNYHRNCEATVAGSSKFCVATSGFLTGKLSNFNPLTYEIRLGAPRVDFLPENALKIRDNDSGIINVGFVGYLNTAEKDIINFLVAKKDIRLTFVGPASEQEMQDYSKLQNFVSTGRLTGQDLYNAVAGFDVGIVPYSLKSKVDRTPNKLWLYLSLGKPVVISNIKSIQNWEFSEGYVYRANDYDEFYSCIKKAYYENNKSLVSGRIAFAGENTWEKRIEEFLNILVKSFPGTDYIPADQNKFER